MDEKYNGWSNYETWLLYTEITNNKSWNSIFRFHCLNEDDLFSLAKTVRASLKKTGKDFSFSKVNFEEILSTL